MLESLEEIEAAAIKDPMRIASLSAKSQLRKRFYCEVTIGETENGSNILLDGKPIKTPSGELLVAPNTNAAKLISVEWHAQEHVIDPQTMPVTRLLNTSIDGVANDMQAVKDDIVRFAGSDLICYRAESPQGLVFNQQKYWDPLIDWADKVLNVNLSVQTGIMHVSQPEASIENFRRRIDAVDCPVILSALHSLTAISGSAIIALALHDEEIDSDCGWNAAHVDEDWQISQWGEDDEAIAFRQSRVIEYRAALELLAALNKA